MKTLRMITLFVLIGLPISAKQNPLPWVHRGSVSLLHSSKPLDTGVGSRNFERQSEFTASQNYPNPFRLETTIEYILPKSTHVEIAIYNARGDRIRTLISESENTGTHRVMWDGKDHWGQIVAHGSYYYRAIAGDLHITRRMQIVG